MKFTNAIVVLTASCPGSLGFLAPFLLETRSATIGNNHRAGAATATTKQPSSCCRARGCHFGCQSPSLQARLHHGRRPFGASRPLPNNKVDVSLVKRQMYNLPPSGGGGGRSNFDGLFTNVLWIVGIIAFFMSPLGSIFFAITNSLFLLAILTPVVLAVGVNAWQFFNTTTGSCPTCGAPLRVLKDGTPTLCFNCGSLVMANSSGKEVQNAPEVYTSSSRQYDEDDFSVGWFEETIMGVTGKKKGGSNTNKKQVIIDVEIEDKK